MFLTAYAQAAGQRVIQLWVGVFGTETPAAPTFVIDRTPANPTDVTAMTPIRDGRTGPGARPLNHRGVFRFDVPDAGRTYLVQVTAGSERFELTAQTLPDAVPPALDGGFNILLCSCYYQPEDWNGLLGSVVSQIQLRPHLTVLAGDQVYLDLPLFEDLPETEAELSRALGDKYFRNWTSTHLRTPGLAPVLAKAPIVSIPDDHEFWNNFPLPQKQLPNTWQVDVRERWASAALALYEDYQLGGPSESSGATRLDVTPLKMLFLDTRSHRQDDFRTLMPPASVAALSSWTSDLIAERRAGRPAVGVLASGQALFIDPPSDKSRMINVDAHLGNYVQFDLVMDQLARLADEGVPVVYLTGDVHWGRVAGAQDQHNSGRTMLYEVIASPSRLLRVPFLDAAKEARSVLGGIFGNSSPWPRHSDPQQTPDRFGKHRRFKLSTEYCRRGDHVAIISFSGNGGGVDLRVNYYAIHTDKAISRSESAGPYQVRVT